MNYVIKRTDQGDGQEKRFVVTKAEYDKRDRFGFVITDQEEVKK